MSAARSWIGDGVEVLVERGLTAALGASPDPLPLAEALRNFDLCYRNRLFVDSSLYPGVVEMLTELIGSGLTVGCVTNKREAYARKMLELAGIASCFSFIHGGDTFGAKKPDPAPLRKALESWNVQPDAAVMIGDSSNDREAARAAGTEFVFAAYGYGPADDAGLRRGFGTISSAIELPALLCARQRCK